jgi:crotonobetainyl-CoA:carnitine CoA-transferase CaiB-like acyl-CoA transferase
MNRAGREAANTGDKLPELSTEVLVVSKPFRGVKVVEVAAWTFVPGAGAIMADLGADVIKVEPPEGDPQRALRNPLNIEGTGANPFLEIPNRGKRSIVLDLTTNGGREVLKRLVSDADVFLTSYLPRQRARLGIDAPELHRRNPGLIYVKGSGWGSKGPMVDVGGFDSAAAWSTAGTAYKLTGRNANGPVTQPAAFYDLQGSNSIAGAVAMALFRRERTGEGAVVDVSLLATGMWAMGPDIAAAPFAGDVLSADRTETANPIVNYYRTKDGRWINLVCLQADRFWPELCRLIDRPDLVDDLRFADASARSGNRQACIAELDRTFAERTLTEWRGVLARFSGVWAPALAPSEVHDHVQVTHNGYLQQIVTSDGTSFRLVAPPYQFEGQAATPAGPAPELGQHSEEVLRSAGLDSDSITALREQGAFG